MLVLALDTTTRPGSIALVRDDEVLSIASGDAARTHAERLPAEIVRLLSDRRLDVTAIDTFAVAAGPGSFTGLRIGIATIQGLAFALNRPVVAVSSLDALARIAAESAGQSPALVAAWMDAQRSEVFAALYRVSDIVRPLTRAPRRRAAATRLDPNAAPPQRGNRVGDHGAAALGTARLPRWGPLGRRAGGPAQSGRGELVEPRSPKSEVWAFEVVDGPVSERPAVVLDRWRQIAAGRAIWLAGDGVFRYRQLLVEGFHAVEPLPPLAPVIGRIGVREAAAGRAVAPHAVRPIYVRRPDAELARDRREIPADHKQS
jgi:tRNA threonylcarbamoyl adenosine modification protein YeaZ